MSVEAGAFIALFLMVLGSYVFIFNASNHLSGKLSKFQIEMAERLARIETTLKIEKKEGR